MSELRMHFPELGMASIEQLVDGLEPAAEAPKERPFTAVVMASTLDGRAAIGGRAGPIGSELDFEQMMRLRSRFDAVIVGGGTMRAERYGRLVPDPGLRAAREAAGLAPDPLAVIVTGSLELPWDAELFTCGEGSVLIHTTADDDPPETATPVELVRHKGKLDLARVLRELRAKRGVRALDCEGGPTLAAELLALGAVDELFLTIAPKLTGGGDEPMLLTGALGEDRRLEPLWLLERGGELFGRYKVLG